MKKNVHVSSKPVETKKTRTVQEIQIEYQTICSNLGNEVHRLDQAPLNIQRMKNRLRELDIEGEFVFKLLEDQRVKAEKENDLKAAEEAVAKAKALHQK